MLSPSLQNYFFGGRMKSTLILAFVFFAFFGAHSSFAVGLQEVETILFTVGEPYQIEVKYFAHNSPNIQEFLAGKVRVSAVLNRVSAYGFVPSVQQLEIGIAPKTKSGGTVVKQDGKLFVSVTSTDDELERGLLQLFLISAQYGNVVFFMHNAPSLNEFNVGRAKVEAVLQKFTQAGLKLNLPEKFEVGIAPRDMSGGGVVVEGGRLYISITASDDEIERHFTKYASP